MRILLVDDAAFMRMMLKNVLVKEGYECVEASNGTEALLRYREYRPELVLMDITMPEMDGITAVKELKKLDADVRVIMCSALGQQAMVMDAIQAGATDFIVKPFKSERVLDAVHKALAKTASV